MNQAERNIPAPEKNTVFHIDWTKSHCGVLLCTFDQTEQLMPEVIPILRDLSDSPEFWKDKLIDVKVHMLMPKQFPCIPNWHCDFLPRDEHGNRIKGKPSGELMYAWISGGPLTEFRDREGSYFIEPQEWHAFTQSDSHRGTMSTMHTWRCFVRVIPAHFAHTNSINSGQIRRHCQVYLNAGKFRW